MYQVVHLHYGGARSGSLGAEASKACDKSNLITKFNDSGLQIKKKLLLFAQSN